MDLEHRHHERDAEDSSRPWVRSWPSAALAGVLLAAGAYVLVAHTAHVLRVLPVALILLCPFLHLFIHRGHGGHDGDAVYREHDGRSGGGRE